MRHLRVLVSEPQSARGNIALTAALAELHRTGGAPDTLRIYSYPKAVLVGRHQIVREVVNVANCRKTGVEIARRITGGGAIYTDRGVLTWDLIIGSRDFGATAAGPGAAIEDAIAAGIGRLGLPAQRRKQNEIEIAGRKVCGMSGYFDGPTLVYQGSILIDADFRRMASALSLPSSRPRGALGKRLANISEFLGRRPESGEVSQALVASIANHMNYIAERAPLTAEEHDLAGKLHDEELGTDDFVDGIDPALETAYSGKQLTGEGVVEAHIRTFAGEDERIDQIWLTGAFSASPARVIFDLEAALRGTPLRAAPEKAREFLAAGLINIRGATPLDIVASIEAANSVAKGAPRAAGRR